MSTNKLAKKIIKDIESGEKILAETTIKDFNKLTREEAMESLLCLIERETDGEVKRKLIEVYESSHWVHDKNLLLLSIWNSYRN